LITAEEKASNELFSAGIYSNWIEQSEALRQVLRHERAGRKEAEQKVQELEAENGRLKESRRGATEIFSKERQAFAIEINQLKEQLGIANKRMAWFQAELLVFQAKTKELKNGIKRLREDFAQGERQSKSKLIAQEEVIFELKAKTEQQSAEILNLRKQIFADSSERSKQKVVEEAESKAPFVHDAGETEKRKRGKQPKAQGFGRRSEEGLKRVPVWHFLSSAECPHCRLPYADCEPQVSEEVDIEEKIYVNEHFRQRVRRVCRCPNELVPRIVTARLPGKLIANSKYSNRFWHYVIEEKYFLQRPLNRVITKLRYMGLTKLSAGVLTNGLMCIYKQSVFEAIYIEILEHNKAAGQWNMDDTGWKVFCEGSSQWHMWVSVSIDTCVFVLDPARSNVVVGKLLSGVTEGIICADRHSSFKAFIKRNDGFFIAFCWAHQRRDYIEMQIGYPELSNWCQAWIDRIDAVFHQNKVRIGKLNEPEEFKREDSILRKMLSSMEIDADVLLERSEGLHPEQLGRMRSLKEHWSGLTIFVDRPTVPMDNNAAERSLRNLVVGRKNYYGSRAVWSGDLLAQLATIYATLERNKVNARQWMNDYITACADNGGKAPEDLSRFLPWKYEPNNVAPATEAQTPNGGLNVSIIADHVQHQPAFAKPPPMSK